MKDIKKKQKPIIINKGFIWTTDNDVSLTIIEITNTKSTQGWIEVRGKYLGDGLDFFNNCDKEQFRYECKDKINEIGNIKWKLVFKEIKHLIEIAKSENKWIFENQ